MQDKDFKWFISHYDELYKKYGKSFLAIKNKKVIGVYNSHAEGVRATSRTEQLGTFIIQECNGDTSAYTVIINNINKAG